MAAAEAILQSLPDVFTDLVLACSEEEGRLMEQAALPLPGCEAQIVAQGADGLQVVQAAASMYAQARANFEGHSDVPHVVEAHRDWAERILFDGGALVQLVVQGTPPSATQFYRTLDALRVSAFGLGLSE